MPIQKIAVYQTGETGAPLFQQTMQQIANEAREAILVVPVTGDDICNDILMEREYIGLIMPGRTSGQTYRDELGLKGNIALLKAAEDNNLCMLNVCAGSYITSQTVYWSNEFQPHESKIVTNENALFKGMAIGAFSNIWHDGYSSDYKLAAKVVDVTFDAILPEPVKGHSIYWGGGVFIPDPDAGQNIVTLARHAGEVQVKNFLPDTPKAFHTYDRPAAVIEFDVGGGKAIFSNIHPEISGHIFKGYFGLTPQAQEKFDIFQQDARNIAASDPLNRTLFYRFLDNCLNSAACKGKTNAKRAKNLLPVQE